MIKPNTKFAVILTIEQINYLLGALEQVYESNEDPKLENILQQFDESCCELDENEEFIRT